MAYKWKVGSAQCALGPVIGHNVTGKERPEVLKVMLDHHIRSIAAQSVGLATLSGFGRAGEYFRDVVDSMLTWQAKIESQKLRFWSICINIRILVYRS